MSTSEQTEPSEANGAASPTHPATVVTGHEGEDGMGSRSLTVGRYEEIRRRLAEGRGVREIARALSCARDTVREVRDGLRHSPDAPNRPLKKVTVGGSLG
jgi:DNA-binding NarL/FixJ family response regulator